MAAVLHFEKASKFNNRSCDGFPLGSHYLSINDLLVKVRVLNYPGICSANEITSTELYFVLICNYVYVCCSMIVQLSRTAVFILLK